MVTAFKRFCVVGVWAASAIHIATNDSEPPVLEGSMLEIRSGDDTPLRKELLTGFPTMLAGCLSGNFDAKGPKHCDGVQNLQCEHDGSCLGTLQGKPYKINCNHKHECVTDSWGGILVRKLLSTRSKDSVHWNNGCSWVCTEKSPTFNSLDSISYLPNIGPTEGKATPEVTPDSIRTAFDHFNSNKDNELSVEEVTAAIAVADRAAAVTAFAAVASAILQHGIGADDVQLEDRSETGVCGATPPEEGGNVCPYNKSEPHIYFDFGSSGTKIYFPEQISPELSEKFRNQPWINERFVNKKPLPDGLPDGKQEGPFWIRGISPSLGIACGETNGVCYGGLNESLPSAQCFGGATAGNRIIPQEVDEVAWARFFKMMTPVCNSWWTSKNPFFSLSPKGEKGFTIAGSMEAFYEGVLAKKKGCDGFLSFGGASAQYGFKLNTLRRKNLWLQKVLLDGGPEFGEQCQVGGEKTPGHFYATVWDGDLDTADARAVRPGSTISLLKIGSILLGEGIDPRRKTSLQNSDSANKDAWGLGSLLGCESAPARAAGMGESFDNFMRFHLGNKTDPNSKWHTDVTTDAQLGEVFEVTYGEFATWLIEDPRLIEMKEFSRRWRGTKEIRMRDFPEKNGDAPKFCVMTNARVENPELKAKWNSFFELVETKKLEDAKNFKFRLQVAGNRKNFQHGDFNMMMANTVFMLLGLNINKRGTLADHEYVAEGWLEVIMTTVKDLEEANAVTPTGPTTPTTPTDPATDPTTPTTPTTPTDPATDPTTPTTP